MVVVSKLHSKVSVLLFSVMESKALQYLELFHGAPVNVKKKAHVRTTKKKLSLCNHVF